jgi:hypothetical protein
MNKIFDLRPPVDAKRLEILLTKAHVMYPEADPWVPPYVDLLHLEVPEWPKDNIEMRLRATSRAHHQHQTEDLAGVRNENWANWYANYLIDNWDKPLYPRAHPHLTGANGNAFNVIGIVKQALKGASVSSEAIEMYAKQATEGSYDDLLQTSMRWTEVQ